MNILVDTSIWVDHFNKGDLGLVRLLDEDGVLCHPFVVGELACGFLKDRSEVLDLLRGLPMASKVEDEELLYFIEEHRLFGRGVGLVDLHLLASTRLDGTRFWTRDKRLGILAEQLGVAYP